MTIKMMAERMGVCVYTVKKRVKAYLNYLGYEDVKFKKNQNFNENIYNIIRDNSKFIQTKETDYITVYKEI